MRSVAVMAGAMLAGLGAVAGANQAMAYDSTQSWNPFTQQRAAYSAPTDRQFVREWESNPPRGYPTISKSNINPTKAAIKRYEEIVKDGGWPKLPSVKLEVGTTHGAVSILRERLLKSGDLREDSAYSDYYDWTLEKALKRFQASNGLTPTGITDKRTISALNVPAQVRLKQLKVNLNRLYEYGQSDKSRYVVVNIPSAQIEAVEAGQVVTRHAGVVGKPDRRTPILKSSIHELNFNPIWRLPPTVIREDLIPKGREMSGGKVDVLTKYGIDAYDGNGRKLDPTKINWKSGQPFNLSYSQKPGKENPLGFLKINFHNGYSVYLHDTPSDRLFGRNFRAASSGCVRVDDIETLAAWILRDNDGWSRERIMGLKESGESQNVSVKKAVPLHFVYLTAWATEDGVVQFRRDLYLKDGVGDVAAAY